MIEMSEVREWHRGVRVERTLNALKENGFKTKYASTRIEAVEEILKLIPKDTLVGVGGSITIREMGLMDALSQRGNRVAQHWQKGLSWEESMAIRRQQLTSDVFLTSSNAIMESG